MCVCVTAVHANHHLTNNIKKTQTQVSVRASPDGDAEELGLLKPKDCVIVAKEHTSDSKDWLLVRFLLKAGEEGKLVSGAAHNSVS